MSEATELMFSVYSYDLLANTVEDRVLRGPSGG